MLYDRAYIEVSNICNLQCTFCPEVVRDRKIMSTTLFDSLLSQVKPITREITLHLMGEPLAHPEFDTLVSLAERHGTPIQLTTNGTLLTRRDRSEQLLSPIFRQINFSVQSLFDNYPQEKAAQSLGAILDFIEPAAERRPDLYFNLRLWNLSDTREFEFWNSILFDMLRKRFGFDGELGVDVRRKKSVPVRGRLYLHFDSRFEWPALSHPVVRESGYCHALKTHFGVLADGTVVPCCLDKEAAIPLGKFTGGSPDELTTILQSEKARDLREGFDRFEVRAPLCQRCTFIERFDRKKRP